MLGELIAEAGGVHTKALESQWIFNFYWCISLSPSPLLPLSLLK